MMQHKIMSLIIAALVLSNVFFAIKYLSLNGNASLIQNGNTQEVRNENVSNFAKLFVIKVLKAEDEIDLEARVELENSVKATEDQEIIQKWKDFTESETDLEAQSNVKDLLELLVNKI